MGFLRIRKRQDHCSRNVGTIALVRQLAIVLWDQLFSISIEGEAGEAIVLWDMLTVPR